MIVFFVLKILQKIYLQEQKSKSPKLPKRTRIIISTLTKKKKKKKNLRRGSEK